MSRIFINYRRGDASNSASRLCEWLSERYGEEQVFMDVDTIVPGRPWREAIDTAVGSSDLVLAVIGNNWLPELRRRSDAEDDFMRHELETALQRNISIIPVLVDGARMPSSSELPSSLATLSDYHAFEVRNERFRFDKQELLRLVDRALGTEQEAPSQPEPPEPVVTIPGPTSAPPTDQPVALEIELNKWNWGAFLLTWIWGIGNGVYRSFLVLIPIYGIYEWIMLGKNGNRLAYEKRPSGSVEGFRNTQRKWAMWGIIVDSVLLIIYIAIAGSAG